MRILEVLTQNPVIRFAKEQVKQHPYLTTSAVAGLVLGGTLYDSITYVGPIQERARQEAYAICNYPSTEELEFANNIPSNVSPMDRQRANQIKARVNGCAATATMLENQALSDNGRPLYVLGLLAEGASGAILLGSGFLKLANRRRTAQTTPS